MEKQITINETDVELQETTEEFISVFDGIGLDSQTEGACKGCGSKMMFGLKLAF